MEEDSEEEDGEGEASEGEDGAGEVSEDIVMEDVQAGPQEDVPMETSERARQSSRSLSTPERTGRDQWLVSQAKGKEQRQKEADTGKQQEKQDKTEKQQRENKREKQKTKAMREKQQEKAEREKQKAAEKFEVGDFVVAVYEEKWLIAQVDINQDAAGETHVNLNYMECIGDNLFKWPKCHDLLLTLKEDILMRCSAPILVGSSIRANHVGLKASEALEANAALAKLIAKVAYLQLSTFQFLFHIYQYHTVTICLKFQSWFLTSTDTSKSILHSNSIKRYLTSTFG